MKPMTETHLSILRRHMVEVIDMHFDLAEDDRPRRTWPELRRALLAVPRHLFVPTQLMVVSYQDTPLPIGSDKTLSQPFIGALMLELLGAEPGGKVLEVGTGLGWQAAVLAELGATLYSVEIVEEFAQAGAAAPGRASTIRSRYGSATARAAGPSMRRSTASRHRRRGRAAEGADRSACARRPDGDPARRQGVQQLSLVEKGPTATRRRPRCCRCASPSSKSASASLSAGILMWRRRAGAIEVLLAHFGGPLWANKDAGAWSIP